MPWAGGGGAEGARSARSTTGLGIQLQVFERLRRGTQKQTVGLYIRKAVEKVEPEELSLVTAQIFFGVQAELSVCVSVAVVLPLNS